MNDKVKHREFFRPFAASVLSEKADEWFEIPTPSPADSFMLCARRIRKDKIGRIPAVTHVDGTCRIQRVHRETNPLFHRLICEFEMITGVPAVLNTSFNDREPIICSPEDAIRTCLKAGIRYLVLGESLVDFGEEELTEEQLSELIADSIVNLGEFAQVPVMRPFMSR